MYSPLLSLISFRIIYFKCNVLLNCSFSFFCLSSYNFRADSSFRMDCFRFYSTYNYAVEALNSFTRFYCSTLVFIYNFFSSFYFIIMGINFLIIIFSDSPNYGFYSGIHLKSVLFCTRKVKLKLFSVIWCTEWGFSERYLYKWWVELNRYASSSGRCRKWA